MAREQARYYLSRVVKLGTLTADGIIDAVMDPVEVTFREHTYTFIDSHIERTEDNSILYVFSWLAKYKKDGEVTIIDSEKRITEKEDIRNLAEASSPFVYIPKYSAIAFQHTWGKLKREQFEKFFCHLVEEKHNRLFVQCILEPISDLRTFFHRLSRLDTIESIDASIRPPNPLFSPVWKELKDYLKKRRLKSASISERSNESKGISSSLTALAQKVGGSTENLSEVLAEHFPDHKFDIGDAAVLMAVDGYGKASIRGTEGPSIVIVKTRDSQRSFVFARSPSHSELYSAAAPIIHKSTEESSLDH